MNKYISIIIPAKNEVEGLRLIIPELIKRYPGAEILIIDDGSTDKTRELCLNYAVNYISHPYCKGNGAAIKSGFRSALDNR